MAEKRSHPRQSFREGTAPAAKLILSGGSLLETTSPRSIEIGATALNVSRGGVCLSLKLDVPWETLTPTKSITLMLEHGDRVWLLPATVIRHERDHRTLGLQFDEPLPSIAPFLTPVELS